MDNNLTGAIAANVTLIQPWWVFVINALVGPISAVVGAGAVYWTSKRAHRLEREKILEEKAKSLREERKKTYVKLLSLLRVLEWDLNKGEPEPSIPFRDGMTILAEFKILASADLIHIFSKNNLETLSHESINAFMNEAIPVMAKELQDEDVYVIVREKGSQK